MRFMPVVLFAAAVLFAAPLFASDKPAPAVNADTKESFDAVSKWVHGQMKDGGRYAHVTEAEKSKIDGRFDEMDKLFEQRGSVAQMSPSEKTQMFNAQEEINAILAQRDGERLICKNENPVGSHIPVRTCQTAAEIENRRHKDAGMLGTMDSLNRAQPKAKGPSGN